MARKYRAEITRSRPCCRPAKASLTRSTIIHHSQEDLAGRDRYSLYSACWCFRFLFRKLMFGFTDIRKQCWPAG